MKTITLFFIVYFSFLNLINASIVDTLTAKNTAKNFIFEKITINKAGYKKDVELKYIKTENSNNKPIFHIFNLKNQTGFIIVSAESKSIPVLGYSFETSYNEKQEVAPTFVEWMNHYKEQIDYIRQNNIAATKNAEKLWTKYSSKPDISKNKESKSVSPLLTTRWNQGKYYNQLCPADTKGQDGHVWTGCVATAMAQIMKYWNYPDYGSGQHTYTDYTYGAQTADFANTYYDWTAMPNSLNNYNTAVATLMYHCGVAVNMHYGINGSGAYSSTAASALKKFFDYSYTLHLQSKTNDSIWNILIKSELDLGHPLYYKGNGHAWVCDGYQETDYFHMNWGWGGSYNGYFYLKDLTPGSYNFTYSQAAIINCYPDYQNPQCNGITIVTEPMGTLNDGSPAVGYYTNYSNCSDCEYLIQPSGATSIFVDFESFSTVEGEDSLYVYDGADASAPLIYALSGDTIPNNFFSSTGSVYFHFVSDSFRTAPGWVVSYTTAFNDVGIIHQSAPLSKTCGQTNDTVQVLIKNFGANTQTNVPVVVEVNTPTGFITLNAVFPGPIARNEWKYFNVGTINTTVPGTYSFTAYTNLPGDTVINSNDTNYCDIVIKTIVSVPHAEVFDNLHGNMGDWNDKYGASFPEYETNGTDTNYLMRAWVDRMMSMFLLYDKNIKNITTNTNLLFDYRFLKAGGQWPPTDSAIIYSNEMLYVIVSTDCGETFDTIFTIDTLNHVNSSQFATKKVSLADYIGQEIIIGFVSQWDTGMAIIDIDNVVIIDNIIDNTISSNQSICENEVPKPLIGSLPTGGIGEYNFYWKESNDSIIWRTASGVNNLQNYSPPILLSTTFYKRIVSDTFIYADTSNVIKLTYYTKPTIKIQGSTIECENTILSGNGISEYKYYWSTGDTVQTITVNTSGNYSLMITDTNGCSNIDTVSVIIYGLPDINLGADTVICANDTIILDAGIYDNYLWSTGETSQTIVVDSVGIGLNQAMFFVQVTDSNNCINSDTVNISFNICSGIKNNSENIINVYPNPTNDFLIINGKQISEIYIINIKGNIVKKVSIQNEKNVIDLRTLSKGIYFIKIITLKGSVVKKIVIE